MPPDKKGVVFCTLRSHRNLFQKALKVNGHKSTRIDGTMCAKERLEAVTKFKEEDATTSPRFIFCSLLAAGTGINLTRGNVAFLLSSWWNAGAENSASKFFFACAFFRKRFH